MPIEFVCPNCQTHLRVPDGTAGQLASCPSCQQHVPIPHANPFLGGATNDAATGSAGAASAGAGASGPAGVDFNRPPSRPASPPPPPATSPSYTNPYAAPTSTDVYEPTATHGELTHTQVTIGQLLSDTWTVVSQNIWPVVILGLVLLGLIIVVQVITMGSQGIAALAMQQSEVLGGLLYVVSFVIQQVISVALAVIPIRYALNLVRGASDHFQGVFNFSGREILRCLGVQIVVILISMALAMVVAIPLAIVAGVIVALSGNGGGDGAILLMIPVALVVGAIMLFLISRVSLAFYFLLDRKQGIMESVTSSWQFTKGNALAFVLSLLIGGVLAAAASIITCFIGSLFALPAFQMIYAVTYFRITGQEMAIDCKR